MSLLNDEAVKVMIMQPDILSEEGKIQSIWDMFTANVNYQDDDNTNLKVILKYTDGNVIKHLLFGDEDCMTRINQYHNMILDVKKVGVSNNTLTNFMYALDSSLTDYISIKDNSSTNIKINMDDNFVDPSYKDQAIILSAMIKNNLIDSNEVQSLLDDRNLEMLTTANRCMSICSKGESPSNDRSCGIQKAKELSLKDFGTNTEEIINCIKKLLNEDVDLFPNSPSDFSQMIFPIDNFDVSSIYRQGSYIPNLASYGILSASSQYIKNSFELDNDTAIYELSSLMNQLEGFMDKFSKSTCLILYMVAGALIIRYLKTKTSDDDSEVVSKIYTLKRNINNAYSQFINLNETEPSKMSNTVRIPEELKDFVRSADCNMDMAVTRLFSEDNGDIYGDVNAALDDILSGIEEVRTTLEEGYGVKISTDDMIVAKPRVTGALSSLTESSGIEQAPSNDIAVYEATISEAATKFHNELNSSLLERNFENAANQIALEVALLEQIDNRLIRSLEVTNIAESLQRDISTYERKINSSSTGISSYRSSATTYVESLLGKV